MGEDIRSVRDHDEDIDLDRAMHDPGKVFRTPDEVVRHPKLSLDEKLKILQEWELDAKRLSESEDESMTGGEPNLLDQVSKARLRLIGEQG